jgi:hypothetical protein
LVLLLVIALVWLTVVTVVVAVCRAAARGDADRPRGRETSGEPVRDGLVVWDRAAAASLRGDWPPARTRGSHTRPLATVAGKRDRRPAVNSPR